MYIYIHTHTYTFMYQNSSALWYWVMPEFSAQSQPIPNHCGKEMPSTIPLWMDSLGPPDHRWPMKRPKF